MIIGRGGYQILLTAFSPLLKSYSWILHLKYVYACEETFISMLGSWAKPLHLCEHVMSAELVCVYIYIYIYI
jgi:hypothetical protein